MTFRLRHLFGALLLHVLLFGLLAGGAQCSSKPVRPPPMQGVLLDASRERKAELKREEQAEKKKREEEADKKKRQEEEKEKHKQDDLKKQALEKAEQQKKLAADAKKRKEDAEKKKRDEQAEKKKKEEDKNKKTKEEEKAKQEDSQRELQDKLRLEDEMRQEALNREAAKRASAQASAEKATRQSEWAAKLVRAVESKWIRPSTVTQKFSCQIRVLLLPDGTVSSATIVKSCGSSSLDKSVEDAALRFRETPLPKPADPSVFDRDLIINFEPGNQ